MRAGADVSSPGNQGRVAIWVVDAAEVEAARDRAGLTLPEAAVLIDVD